MYSSAPMERTSERLSVCREIPTTREAPRALAKRTPKWPRPPTPMIPTWERGGLVICFFFTRGERSQREDLHASPVHIHSASTDYTP